MAVIGISMVKNEADIIETTLRHMAAQVDRLIVADNCSTDGTRDLLSDLTRDLPLTVVDDPEPGYYQAAKMTALGQRALAEGAEWVVPFDADEIWYSGFGTLAELLGDVASDVTAVEARLYYHLCTGADDPREPDPVRRMGWRKRDSLGLPKVAARAAADLTIEQGNHAVRYGGGVPYVASDFFVIRHFPYRSAEHFVAKARQGAAAYAATDLPEEQGAHWRGYGRILAEQGEGALAAVFAEHFYVEDPESNPTMIYDPAPVV